MNDWFSVGLVLSLWSQVFPTRGEIFSFFLAGADHVEDFQLLEVDAEEVAERGHPCSFEDEGWLEHQLFVLCLMCSECTPLSIKN